MKNFVVLAVVALGLGACGISDPKQPNAELQALQDKCSAGDMNACSDLAHAVKSQ